VSARVIDEPLAVAFWFSDGTSYTLSLHHLPCPALVRDLARGLAAMAHPHGDVDARNTAGRDLNPRPLGYESGGRRPRRPSQSM